MVSIDAGNLYISDDVPSEAEGSVTSIGGTIIKIQTTKLDFNYDNAITVFPIPISSGNRTSKTAQGRAIDLKRIKEVISVQGFLIEESDSRAIDKRNNLITLGKTANSLTVVWGLGNYQTLWKRGTAPYGAFILKMMFTETAGLIADGSGYTGDPPPERSIAVQIQLVRGKDLDNK